MNTKLSHAITPFQKPKMLVGLDLFLQRVSLTGRMGVKKEIAILLLPLLLLLTPSQDMSGDQPSPQLSLRDLSSDRLLFDFFAGFGLGKLVGGIKAMAGGGSGSPTNTPSSPEPRSPRDKSTSRPQLVRASSSGPRTAAGGAQSPKTREGSAPHTPTHTQAQPRPPQPQGSAAEKEGDEEGGGDGDMFSGMDVNETEDVEAPAFVNPAIAAAKSSPPSSSSSASAAHQSDDSVPFFLRQAPSGTSPQVSGGEDMFEGMDFEEGEKPNGHHDPGREGDLFGDLDINDDDGENGRHPESDTGGSSFSFMNSGFSTLSLPMLLPCN